MVEQSQCTVCCMVEQSQCTVCCMVEQSQWMLYGRAVSVYVAINY